MIKKTNENYNYFQQYGMYQRDRHTSSFKMASSHFHDIHELYILLNGKTTYFIGNELYFLEAGDAVFVPKGVFHKTASDESTIVERVLISFDDEFAGNDFYKYINEMQKHKHMRFPTGKFYLIEDILNKISVEERKNHADRELMLKLYLRELLILISRHKTPKEREGFNEYETLIQDAAKFISSNCNADLSLDSLAKKYALSPCYFSRQFKAVTGIGLNEYINISRITTAEKLLSTKKISITKVAMECGFNDSNYFAAVFKKIKGITPKKYSMQISNNSNK